MFRAHVLRCTVNKTSKFLSGVITGDISSHHRNLKGIVGLVVLAAIWKPASICNHSQLDFYVYFRYKSVNSHCRTRTLWDRNVGGSCPLLSLMLQLSKSDKRNWCAPPTLPLLTNFKWRLMGKQTQNSTQTTLHRTSAYLLTPVLQSSPLSRSAIWDDKNFIVTQSLQKASLHSVNIRRWKGIFAWYKAGYCKLWYM